MKIIITESQYELLCEQWQKSVKNLFKTTPKTIKPISKIVKGGTELMNNFNPNMIDNIVKDEKIGKLLDTYNDLINKGDEVKSSEIKNLMTKKIVPEEYFDDLVEKRKSINKIIKTTMISDITITPAQGFRRGIDQEKGQSFDILLDNPEVVKKLKTTKMGKDGSMTSWAAEGPGSGEGTFKYKADTTQWEVWEHMNYITVTPKHRAHWYHGKAPGGLFKDEYGNYSKGSGVDLPELNIDRFGTKVYKGLLSQPKVGYIISDSNASDKVKSSVYRHLMEDKSLIWISYGGEGGTTYDDIIIMDPKAVNINKIKKGYEDGKLIDDYMKNHRTKGGKFRSNYWKY